MEKTDNNPLVSIIVPVYKAEKYIHQCVDSLLTQTYRNIEVILVDDGSPDRSGAICDEYAAADSRVKVIHQPNGGVSVARQTGMDNATGDYFIHADPDDWVESTMIEELMAKAIEEDADMVICDYYEEDGGKSSYKHNNIENTTSAKRLLEMTISDAYLTSFCLMLVRSVISKAIRLTPVMSCREDQLYIVRLLNNNPKVSYLPKAFYHYRIDNASSLTHDFSEKRVDSCYKFAIEVNKEISNRHDLSEDSVARFKIKSLIYLIKFGRYYWFKNASKLFPEVHAQAIEEGRKYKWYRPLSSCLSIALRGKPKFAYFCYRLNMLFIEVKESLRKR